VIGSITLRHKKISHLATPWWSQVGVSARGQNLSAGIRQAEPRPQELSKIQKTFDLEMFWCILIGHAETGDSVGNARRGRAHGSLR
jgi:hypothetical protein